MGTIIEEKEYIKLALMGRIHFPPFVNVCYVLFWFVCKIYIQLIRGIWRILLKYKNKEVSLPLSLSALFYHSRRGRCRQVQHYSQIRSRSV